MGQTRLDASTSRNVVEKSYAAEFEFVDCRTEWKEPVVLRQILIIHYYLEIDLQEVPRFANATKIIT